MYVLGVINVKVRTRVDIVCILYSYSILIKANCRVIYE